MCDLGRTFCDLEGGFIGFEFIFQGAIPILYLQIHWIESVDPPPILGQLSALSQSNLCKTFELGFLHSPPKQLNILGTSKGLVDPYQIAKCWVRTTSRLLQGKFYQPKLELPNRTDSSLSTIPTVSDRDMSYDHFNHPRTDMLGSW